MALPMDEQRILEEMERMLAADDPRLAAKLAAFGQPGVSQVLRTRRARAVLSLLMLVVIAAAAAVIYMMSAFRPGSGGPNTPQQATSTMTHKTLSGTRSVPLSGPPPAPLQGTARCTWWITPRRITPGICAAWTLPPAGMLQPAQP